MALRTRGVILLLVAFLVGGPLLLVGGIAAYLSVSGTPVIDEWVCSDGEVPYTYPEGGSACADEGGDLPPGAAWDPFGNRPLVCEDRWGWVEVEPDPPASGDETDCVRSGSSVPAGWRPVD